MEAILLEIGILLFIQQSKVSQEKEVKQPQFNDYQYIIAANPKPTGYENNIRELEHVVLVNSPFREDEVIIVISRLGKGEKPIHHSRRFYTVKQYFTSMLKFPESKIVTAIGQPTDGYGLLEFYVGGRQFTVLAVGKNQDLQVTEGDGFTVLFYLPKPKKTRKR